MKKILKVFSTSLVILLLSNTTSYASTLTNNISSKSSVKILDITQQNPTNLDDYNAIITNEKDLNKSLELSNKLDKPIFVQTSDLSMGKIAAQLGIKNESKVDSVTPQNGLSLKGYLVYRSNTEKIEPWFVEQNSNNSAFSQDLEIKVKKIESEASALSPSQLSIAASSWPVADSYSTNITYTEAYVGVSGILYDSGSGSPTGQQDMVVEITPRTDTYYDYSSEYFTSEIDATNGKILDYSPDNYQSATTITISYPWGVSVPFSLGGTFDVSKTGGGVGLGYTIWKFDPTPTSGFYNIKGKVTAEFSESSRPLKSYISTYLTFRTTDKRTGSSSLRTVNYSTSFSG